MLPSFPVHDYSWEWSMAIRLKRLSGKGWKAWWKKVRPAGCKKPARFHRKQPRLNLMRRLLFC